MAIRFSQTDCPHCGARRLAIVNSTAPTLGVVAVVAICCSIAWPPFLIAGVLLLAIALAAFILDPIINQRRCVSCGTPRGSIGQIVASVVCIGVAALLTILTTTIVSRDLHRGTPFERAVEDGRRQIGR